MPDEKKEEQKADPNQNETLTKMAGEIARLQIQSMADSAGAVDAGKVYEVVNKNVKAEITKRESSNWCPLTSQERN
jgi:hypothetical protein